MSTYEIHAIFVTDGTKTGIINLSRQYEIRLSEEERVVKILRDAKAATALRERTLASVTTLFGENGSGKTRLMHHICQSFSGDRKNQRLASLYSENGTLYLHRGGALKEWSIDSTEAVGDTKRLPLLKSIFYSSSPFESGRLDRLVSNPSVLNASIKLADEPRFDGLALCDNLKHIRDVPQFLSDITITVRGWVTNGVTIANLVERMLERHAYTSEREAVGKVRDFVRAATNGLKVTEKVIAVANLMIINAYLPRNDNLMGAFVGRLMQHATVYSDGRQMISETDTLLGLLDETLSDKSIVPYKGRTVLAFIRLLGGQLREGAKGYRFTEQVKLTQLIEALARAESEWPGIARFASEMGFLEFRISNLSSGEFAFLFLYTGIGAALKNPRIQNADEPVFLLIDEGEMFMHPAWQRDYIRNLLNYIQLCARDPAQVHLVISTHSLILAADAPPNTLFDLGSLRPANGFALGPKGVLEKVYHVPEFAGSYTKEKIDKVVAYLSDPEGDIDRELIATVDALADKGLKKYVQGVIRSRVGADRA